MTNPLPHRQPYPQPRYRHPGIPEASKPWWIKLWLIIPTLAAVLAIGLIATSIINSGGGKELTPASTTPVVDGDVEFQVTKIEVGVREVADVAVVKSSQFIVVTVNMRNLAPRSNRVFLSDQDLIDRAGKKHDTAEVTGKLNDMRFGPDLQPGEVRSIRLAFAVPDSFDLGSLLVRDSSAAAGVSIPLA